jgi:hypothetical protein
VFDVQFLRRWRFMTFLVHAVVAVWLGALFLLSSLCVTVPHSTSALRRVNAVPPPPQCYAIDENSSSDDKTTSLARPWQSLVVTGEDAGYHFSVLLAFALLAGDLSMREQTDVYTLSPGRAPPFLMFRCAR